MYILSLVLIHHHVVHILIRYLCVSFLVAAYDPLDPNGNITIKWDIMSWTPDGYVVSTTILKCHILNVTSDVNLI